MRVQSNVLAGRAALGLLVVCGLTACGRSGGGFVWVDDLPAARAAAGSYTVGVGDVVSVQVWDHERLSTRARVRSDGRISMPLLNDVTVAGKTPAQLARELESELKGRNLVVDPSVNVVLEEAKPLSVAVMGEVSRAGMYTLDAGAGVAEALASAGGLTDFAHKDRIYVVRRTPQPVRIRLTYDALAGARGLAATFRLQAGDVVVAQ
jgi:polysaccharide export outer membrane protein